MRSRRLRLARLAAASALLAVTIGAVTPPAAGQALGAVVAVTPNELSGSSGDAINPVLSGRGEDAGVFDIEVNVNGWALFDVPGPEQMTGGAGITVSGNGCVSLAATRFNPPPTTTTTAPIILFFRKLRQTQQTVFTMTDRCRGITREVYRTDFSYSQDSNMALSHTGRFAAIVVFDGQIQQYVVLRVDTESLALAEMPFPANYTSVIGDLGVDISDNGNVIVASAAFGIPPGGGTLPAGGSRVNVVAWDVSANSTTVVSADGTPGSAAFPSVSGDGRYVSFTAAKPLAGGESGNGPWVYVADRANGAIRRVSNGSDHAYNTSITRDGSQVAYTVGPTKGCSYDTVQFSDVSFNCPGVRVDVAYGPSPGFTSAFSVETISLAPNGSPASGQHYAPSLSGNGRWVAWLSNNGAGLGIAGISGQNAFMRRRDPALAIDPIDFGTISAATSSTLPATVRNTGKTSVSLDSITATPSQFTIQGGGSCAGGSLLPPGATCTVNVRYAAPNNTSTTNGTITVAESGYDPISASGKLIGRSSVAPPPPTTATTVAPTLAPTTTAVGQVPPGRTTSSTSTTAPPGQVSLTADPNPVDFGQVAVGIGSPVQTITVTNVGSGSGQMLTELGGANPDDFFVVTNDCNALVIAPGQSCTLQIIMIPLAGGIRQASLILSAGGVSGDVAMFGDGHFAPLLVASPAAITDKGATTIIGQGFPPNQSFDVHVDPANLVLTATSDATGQFLIPLSAVPNLSLGNYILHVDAVPDVFDLVQGQLVVVLATFEPQAPGTGAFGDALIVTRGG